MSETLVGRARAGLATAIRSKVAGDDFAAAHVQIFDAVGPRWFTPESAIWRVHNDTAMFVGGVRALLLQSLHPLAMQAVSDHSGFRGDPWGRLQRTSHYLASTTFGTIAGAERSIAIVRAVHKNLSGSTPDGTPYRVADPHLLKWVHIAEVDSFLSTHQRFGAERLNDADADAYVADTSIAAAKLGVIDPPTTVAELERQLDSYRPELRISEPAIEAKDLLLRHPPLPGPARIGFGVLAAGGVASLPTWARTMLRLPSLPVTDRLLATPLTAAALGTIRWAMAGASVS